MEYDRSPVTWRHLISRISNDVKRILYYIKGTLNRGFFYATLENFSLICYSDGDCNRDLDERKSITWFMFLIKDTSFTCSSKKQLIVNLSSCEAEYVVANLVVCHTIWLRNVLKHLGFL